MIDTHCHLNYSPLFEDVPGVLSRASLSGVSIVIVPGTGVESSKSAVLLSEKYSSVFSAVGVHPEDLIDTPFLASHLKKLEKLFTDSARVVAVGEVGLDYFYLKDFSAEDKLVAVEAQREMFSCMLELGHRFSKPVIVHCRESFEDVFNLVSKSNVRRVVQHCFVGSRVEANKWLDYGGYISLTGIITYKKNSELRETVAGIPLEKIMLETDAPFLSPEGYRSLPCEPSFMHKTAECLAEIKGISLEEVDEVTSNNARQFFGLS